MTRQTSIDRWLKIRRGLGLVILPLSAAALMASCAVPVSSAQDVPEDAEQQIDPPADAQLAALDTVPVPLPEDLDT